MTSIYSKLQEKKEEEDSQWSSIVWMDGVIQT